MLYHGDDADSHRRRSFFVATVSSPLCIYEDSWDSRCLLRCLDNSKAVTETYDLIDHWLVYGFMELQEGSFFTVDVHGEHFKRGKGGRVCGNFVGILCGIKGDEKFIQRALKVTSNWLSQGVCMYCDASQKGEYLYTFHGPGAAHRATLISNERFFLSGCRPNAWLRLPGFDVQRVFLDWLHIVDLALTPEASASVPWLDMSELLSLLSAPKALAELTSTNAIWAADTQDERLRLAFVDFTSLCRQHKISALVKP